MLSKVETAKAHEQMAGLAKCKARSQPRTGIELINFLPIERSQTGTVMYLFTRNIAIRSMRTVSRLAVCGRGRGAVGYYCLYGASLKVAKMFQSV